MGSLRRRNQYWKKLGLFCGYPICCIENFIHKHKPYTDYMEGCIFDGTGFIPCPKCKKDVEGFTEEEGARWLGRNIFGSQALKYPQLNNA
jgi:hypothetical protein